MVFLRQHEFSNSLQTQTVSQIIQESNSSSYTQPLVTIFPFLLIRNTHVIAKKKKKSYLKISKKTQSIAQLSVKGFKDSFKLRAAIIKTWWHFLYEHNPNYMNALFFFLMHFVRFEPLLSQTAILNCSQISQKNAQSNGDNIIPLTPLSLTREIACY